MRLPAAPDASVNRNVVSARTETGPAADADQSKDILAAVGLVAVALNVTEVAQRVAKEGPETWTEMDAVPPSSLSSMGRACAGSTQHAPNTPKNKNQANGINQPCTCCR